MKAVVVLVAVTFATLSAGCVKKPESADAPATPASLLGDVVAVDGDGNPLRGVAARIAVNAERTHFLSVFSDASGKFPASDLALRGLPVDLPQDRIEFIGRGYGYKTIGPASGGGSIRNLVMTRDALRVEDIPAAAWLQDWPQSTDSWVVTMQCVQCHQLPGYLVRPIAQGIGGIPELKGRTEAWHRVVDDMRGMSSQLTGRLSRRRFETVPTDWRTGNESVLSDRVEARIAPYLAKHMPRNFTTPVWKPEWDMGAAQATQGVQVEEFRLQPEINSWYREVVYSPNSGTVIGVDLGGNRLFELDPRTAKVEFIPIPVASKNTAPHTIQRDENGLIWVSLEDINGVGFFDPVTRQWKVFQDIFGGNMVSHDFSLDATGLVAKDTKGRVWISLVSHNHIAALDPETGRGETFPLPARTGEAKREPPLPYGVVMTADKKFVWVSQHGTDKVFKVSTEMGTVEKTVQYPEGYAPRRMTIDEKDRVWVALSGRGALGLIEGDERVQEYPLPLAGSYPYNALWDPVRQHVWVGTTNAGEVLEFDPASRSFRRYMLPAHREAYLRQFSRDPKTGDVWTAYASKLGEKAEAAVVRISPETVTAPQ